MKDRRLLYYILMLVMFPFAAKSQGGGTGYRLFGRTDTAYVPKEIEDPECLGVNKEAAHAILMPYGNLQEALKGNRHASSYCRSLNGAWKFRWSSWPQKRPENFYRPDYDVSGWANIKVPSNWEVEGYGTPYYSNFNYVFQKDFPHVLSTPPVSYTAYTERDPVGSYRRTFEVPEEWKGRRIFVTFDGVDAGFFLWINGKKVGYSVNSRNAAEFDITDYIKPGENIIAAEVYKYTTGSYIEDQDMWRLSGIFRNVSLWSSPEEHIRDFFIQTDLDEAYRNAKEEIGIKIKNYGKERTEEQTLSAELYEEGKLVAGASASVTVPALQGGEEKKVQISFPVTNPRKWTAETPYLYTTVLQLKDAKGNTEILSSRTGFRKIEIKGREFLVNGTPIKLKGVNRHENWPDDGHAVTEAQMVKDIELIKGANCNHVRTCHYSDDPRWYELCDEYGIYLVAEANLECHGSWDEFNEEPRMKAAIIDREVANVESFKNHPSVIIWSLGNECGSGGSNFRAALQKVRTLDPTRPTHYQGFGIGEKNPADIDSEMYTDVTNVEKHANDKDLVKPFYLCEYAHTMFNSMGSIEEYNDLFNKYPSLLGGAVWEWQDQGIYNHRDPKHPITAYGGGFGEVPNDHYFIHKGVVFSDRSPKPQYPEMKHAYQWIDVQAKDFGKKVFSLHNRYQFTNLNQFSGKWTLSEEGKVISSGSLKTLDIKPGETKDILLPYPTHFQAGKEYFVSVSFELTKDELWAKKGYEIASDQIELPYKELAIEKKKGGELKLEEDENSVKVSGKGFSVEFDKKRGTFSKLVQNGRELLQDEGGPMLHLWRAPHRNDDMWAYDDWMKYGLDKIQWTVGKVETKQTGKSRLEIKAELEGKGKAGFEVHHAVTYTIEGDGTIDARNEVNFNREDINLARIGVRMFLKKSLSRVAYFGRGPMENYSDRKLGSDVGVYENTVKGLMTPYEKPMDCGNHEDLRWLRIGDGEGSTLGIYRKNDLFQFTALPYSDEEMTNVEYKIDLPQSNRTVLCISHQTLGCGSNGCGPRPLEPYRVYSKPTSFEYQIRLNTK